MTTPNNKWPPQPEWMTSQQVADAMGVSRSSVNEWVKDQRHPLNIRKGEFGPRTVRFSAETVAFLLTPEGANILRLYRQNYREQK